MPLGSGNWLLKSSSRKIRKNTNMYKSALIVITGLASLAPATAGLITTIPVGATSTTFTATGNHQGLTSATVNGFTITGTNFIDGDNPFYLGANGVWSSSCGFSWIATGPTGSLS